ncbi:MAG: hypothetical protein ACOX75_05845 [Lachnospiraceae bacterium]
MKQLCVRENVENEVYVYKVKKISTIVIIFLMLCAAGLLLCITSDGDMLIKTLTRADYGGGQRSYRLDVEYDGTVETMDIILDPVSHTEEEILSIFDESYAGIIDELLNENESVDNVCFPINLMASYQGIDISWEIEDTSIVNYNGEIDDSVMENEYINVNLFATLSMGETSRVFCIPLTITAPTLSARELLLQNIMEGIEEGNSIYDKDVSLPESINGKKLYYKKVKDSTRLTLLILGLIALIVIIIGYDKSLEKKVNARRDQMMMDFTEIVFKLSLLYEAGLSIYRAWEKIVTEHETSNPGKSRFAYQEMRLTLEMIKSGVSEAEAYGQFGKRCGLHQYIKLGNLLEQNLSKGTRGMKILLKQEAQDSFEERKRLARKKGEEAGTKMLIPMIMMLMVVIIIVAVPALMSMNL